MIKKLVLSILLLFCSGFITCAKPIHMDCELGDLVGDDVSRISAGKFTVDFHKDEFKKSQIKKFAKECINDGIKNQFQMDCCMTKKMYPGG